MDKFSEEILLKIANQKTDQAITPEQVLAMLSQHLKPLCQTEKQPEFFL